MTSPSQPRRPRDSDGNEPLPGQTDIYDVIDHSHPEPANRLWPAAAIHQRAQAAVKAKLAEKEKK
jgi:hypothetical protein